MNFSVMGNLNTQLKTMEMKTHWNLKKQTKNYTAKSTSLDKWLQYSETLNQKLEELGFHGDEKLRSIHSKLYAGGELTSEEKEYLRVKDPEAYRELMAEETEKKAYEEKLRKCKTKEEVDRLATNQVSKAMSTVSMVENNPNIPKIKKLAIIMGAKRKLDNAMEVTQKFIARGDYAKLPSEKDEIDKNKTETDKTEENTEINKTENSAEQKPDSSKDQSINSDSDNEEITYSKPNTQTEKTTSEQTTQIQKNTYTHSSSEYVKAAYVKIQQNTIPEKESKHFKSKA